MKRRIVVAWAGAMLALAGCSAPVEGAKGEEAQHEGGWMAPPRITSVERQGGPGAGLIVRGDAPPGARVILRGDQEAAFAAGADAAGRFELRVGVLPTAMLLTPEAQAGPFSALGPEQLLLAGQGGDLAVLLIEGGASRRLSGGPALDSVDGDGQGLMVAGRASPGTRVAVSADGAAAQAVADANGRWTAALSSVGDRPVTIAVGGASFGYPGAAASASVGLIERAGAGWRLTRRLSSSATQTSWFPDL